MIAGGTNKCKFSLDIRSRDARGGAPRFEASGYDDFILNGGAARGSIVVFSSDGDPDSVWMLAALEGRYHPSDGFNDKGSDERGHGDQFSIHE